VAQRFELEPSISHIPLTELRKESVVKKLIEEGRTPFVVAYKGLEEEFDPPFCFIPSTKTKPSQIFDLSFEDAAEIALINRKLQREIY